MKYQLNETVVIPYKVITDMKGQLISLLDKELSNEILFTLIASNLPYVRTLIRANYVEVQDESFDDLDIFEDIMPMIIDIIAKAKEDIATSSNKYVLHEYNENFTAILGTHTTDTYKVPLGVVEDVVSAILGMQEIGTLNAESIDKILEDVESTILRSFPTLDCIRIENLNVIEIIRVYRKYFDLGLKLLSGKNGLSLKAQRVSK